MKSVRLKRSLHHFHNPVSYTHLTKKAWMLIQYLIANRKNAVSIGHLVSDIWGQEESRDPLNVLKNLVYRARNILKELCPDEDTEFISYSKDARCV